MPRSRYVSKSHNAKGQKHPGIYGAKKDLAPTPRKTLVQINIPFEVAQKIQERYPEVSLRIAVQNYLQEQHENYSS